MVFRRWKTVLLSSLLGTTVLAGCERAPRTYAEPVRRELALGAAAARAWPDSTSTSATVGLGYLERLRLGLGSPFRLIDYALQDPRLDAAARNHVAWALLARTISGASYEIDPLAFADASSFGSADGARHVQLLEHTLDKTEDPRTAELAIRLAYTIAEAEALVKQGTTKTVANATALLVDRELARRDAQRLLSDDASVRRGVLAAIPLWRSNRKLLVEQPRIAPIAADQELVATRIARDIVDELRHYTLRALVTGSPPKAKTIERDSATDHEFFRRLDESQRNLRQPPQTPVIVVARQLARDAAANYRMNAAERWRWNRFGGEARNEESFVVAYHRLRRHAAASPHLARAALQVAVGLRAYAQESVWYPGMGGPATRELRDLYGFASLRFDESVPEIWRPYYRRMLASALDDLYRVMPGVSLKGLNIRFGQTSGTTEVLAMHEPDKRRLVLPITTSSGTLAHELAHDIDWQESIEKYRIKGDYATDRASYGARDNFSGRVRMLTNASLEALPSSRKTTAHARRPAEIFARNVDWYVSVALAQQGRRNGYLSSVQDEIITGYGTVGPPDVSGKAGDALLSIIADLAPIYREQSETFRALYGTARTPRAYDLARSITEPVLFGWYGSLVAIQSNQQTTLNSLSAACGISMAAPELAQARIDIVNLATEARARGAGMRYMHRQFGEAGRKALLHAIYGEPAASSLPEAVLARDVADRIRAAAVPAQQEKPRSFELCGTTAAALAYLH